MRLRGGSIAYRMKGFVGKQSNRKQGRPANFWFHRQKLEKIFWKVWTLAAEGAYCDGHNSAT